VSVHPVEGGGPGGGRGLAGALRHDTLGGTDGVLDG